MKYRLEAEPLPGIGEVEPGANLANSIVRAARELSIPVGSGDVLVIAQKVVSKSEGGLRDLTRVDVSARALQLGRSLDRDPRLVQVVLEESTEVVRAERGVLITRTRHGLVCANAGIDSSNVPGEHWVSILPVDPDASARRLRDAINEQIGHSPAIVISDSFGRPWRLGQTEVAIGCAGLEPLRDQRGGSDAHGRELTATIDAIADEATSAAGLVRDKDGGDAVVVVRGLERYVTRDHGPGATSVVRPEGEDLFR